MTAQTMPTEAVRGGGSARPPYYSFSQINKDFCSRFVVLGALRLNELLGLAERSLGSLDHLLHSSLTLFLTFCRFPLRCGFLFLPLFRFLFGAKDIRPFK